MTATADLAPAPRRRSAPGTTSILVARLAEWVDPFEVLCVSEETCRTTPSLFREPLFESSLVRRDRGYHTRRIRWFWQRFRYGHDVDPISVHGDIDGVPWLHDGHHRFAGALLAGAERIPASFGGRLDLLRYLQGRRKTRPEA